jgi:hypothetical protein
MVAAEFAIICQLNETESDYDRPFHLEDVCWDKLESTFVYFLDSTRPGVMPAVSLLNEKPRKISVQRKPRESKDDSEFLPLVERAGPIPLTNAIFTENTVSLYGTRLKCPTDTQLSGH